MSAAAAAAETKQGRKARTTDYIILVRRSVDRNWLAAREGRAKNEPEGGPPLELWQQIDLVTAPSQKAAREKAKGIEAADVVVVVPAESFTPKTAQTRIVFE